MTFLLYMAWMFSVLWVAGEVDRLVRKRFLTRWESELAAPRLWFLPICASFFLPGSGQLLNGQPVKALLLILWPFLVGLSFFARPWQMTFFAWWQMLLPYYLVNVLDALVVGVANHFRRSMEIRREQAEARANSNLAALDDFLERRRRSRQPET